MMVTFGANTDDVRLDGGSKGAVIIARKGNGCFSVRLTDQEGGPFVIDATVYARTDLGRRLTEACRMVGAASALPLPPWQQRLVRQVFE